MGRGGPTARAGSTLRAKKELSERIYGVRGLTAHQANQGVNRSHIELASRSTLICRVTGATRWQGYDGRAFLRPAPARGRVVEWQPAVAAFVVGEAAQQAGLDRAGPAVAAAGGAVAGAERLGQRYTIALGF